MIIAYVSHIFRVLCPHQGRKQVGFPNETYLNYGLAADQVAPASDGNATVRAVHHILTALNQLAQVAKLGGAIGVGKYDVLTAGVAEAVRDTATLAAVLGQGDDADDIVQPTIASKVERDLDGAVCAAVVDDDNLVASEGLRHGLVLLKRQPLGRGGADECCLRRLGRRVTTEARVQVLDHLLESRKYAGLLVVGWHYDAHGHLCRLDEAEVGCVFIGLALPPLLGEPAVIPAWELGRRVTSILRARGEVRLLGRQGSPWFGRDEV